MSRISVLICRVGHLRPRIRWKRADSNSVVPVQLARPRDLVPQNQMSPRSCNAVDVLLTLIIGLTGIGIPAGCSQQPLPIDSGTMAQTGPDTLHSDDVTRLLEEPVAATRMETKFRFHEIGVESGFQFQRYDDMRGQRRILEVNGGGVAVLDFDQDGWLDVFMSNGCRLPLAEDTRETPGKLFRNLKNMTFRDCSEGSALRQFGFCFGCAAADANEDGFEDLYVTAVGGNQFWINYGDGTFAEIASRNGTLTGQWGSSAAFADLNADHCLDLYVANYLEESDAHPTLCPEPKSPDGYVGCSPGMFKGVPDTLFLSDGSGGYINASSAAGLESLPGKALGVVICDLGGDCQPEIFVANDGQPNYLLTVELLDPAATAVRGVHLTDQAIAANCALSYEGFAQANMGVAAVDIDRDGARDIFVTHFFGETSTLYRNRTQGEFWIFEDATRISLLGIPSRSKLGFGVAGLDVDNDGWNDLLVANGHVDDRTWFDEEQPFRMTPQVFENQNDGTFRDVSGGAGPYFLKETLGRAVATGDLDRDGRLDVVVSHQLDPSIVLRNDTPASGKSIILRLVGTSHSRTPIGAKVRVIGVDPCLQEQLMGGGSFQAASANEIHLGGLEDRLYDLEVQWPDGKIEVIRGLRNGYWMIRRQEPPCEMKF